jgi:hypothetical protein
VTDKLMVPRLTREQIEEWRACLSRMYAGEFSNMAQIETLCDMALLAAEPAGMTKTVPIEPSEQPLGDSAVLNRDVPLPSREPVSFDGGGNRNDD